MTHNLLAGWWGFISLVTNPFTIAGNLKAGRALKQLGPPQGAPLAAPAPPVRPLWQKPWVFAAPVAIVAVVVTIIVSAATHTSVNNLSAGACIDVPDESSFAETKDVDCSAPHDAEVVGKVSTGSQTEGIDDCEAVALDYLGGAAGIERLQYNGIILDQGGTVCVIESADGSKLTATVKGAGR